MRGNQDFQGAMFSYISLEERVPATHPLRKLRAVPETVRAFVPEGRRYITLGTDGFGRSDTRAALRQFFGVDAQAVAKAAQFALGL